mmetsp:Transcript_131/g.246  ORF Transcript_131/g.246 Transcript_131/m.246 type:complete len:159 (+) Transcript_131:134-610(+)
MNTSSSSSSLKKKYLSLSRKSKPSDGKSSYSTSSTMDMDIDMDMTDNFGPSQSAGQLRSNNYGLQRPRASGALSLNRPNAAAAPAGMMNNNMGMDPPPPRAQSHRQFGRRNSVTKWSAEFQQAMSDGGFGGDMSMDSTPTGRMSSYQPASQFKNATWD